MIIENAERLGLFQLHQLRGRVGRGSKKSHCLLLYQSPMSKNGRERLEAIRSTQDGFKIAELDLKLRGHGEILGTRQTGLSQFKIADLERDQDIVQILPTLISTLSMPKELIKALNQRWLGKKEQYSQS
jgi:ATP-dependent DNA helicase RecG